MKPQHTPGSKLHKDFRAPITSQELITLMVTNAALVAALEGTLEIIRIYATYPQGIPFSSGQFGGMGKIMDQAKVALARAKGQA